MNPRYPEVGARAAHCCEYCHAPEVLFNFPFEVEHVIPPQLGGVDDEMNWALSCRACNVFKGDAIEAVDPETRQAVHLFHPRNDRWSEHFRLARDTGSIVGLTLAGRATVERLRMNTPTQVVARLAWMRLGFYPPT